MHVIWAAEWYGADGTVVVGEKIGFIIRRMSKM